MASGRKGSKTPGFEQALARLEAIVKDLEDGDRPLEESLRLFEEGVSLTRLCASRLEEAQRKIEVLTRGAGGDLRTAPFREPADPDDDSAAESDVAGPDDGDAAASDDGDDAASDDGGDDEADGEGPGR